MVQLTGATFKKFMDKNDNVIVHFVSSSWGTLGVHVCRGVLWEVAESQG